MLTRGPLREDGAKRPGTCSKSCGSQAPSRRAKRAACQARGTAPGERQSSIHRPQQHTAAQPTGARTPDPALSPTAQPRAPGSGRRPTLAPQRTQTDRRTRGTAARDRQSAGGGLRWVRGSTPLPEGRPAAPEEGSGEARARGAHLPRHPPSAVRLLRPRHDPRLERAPGSLPGGLQSLRGAESGFGALPAAVVGALRGAALGAEGGGQCGRLRGGSVRPGQAGSGARRPQGRGLTPQPAGLGAAGGAGLQPRRQVPLAVAESQQDREGEGQDAGRGAPHAVSPRGGRGPAARGGHPPGGWRSGPPDGDAPHCPISPRGSASTCCPSGPGIGTGAAERPRGRRKSRRSAVVPPASSGVPQAAPSTFAPASGTARAWRGWRVLFLETSPFCVFLMLTSPLSRGHGSAPLLSRGDIPATPTLAKGNKLQRRSLNPCLTGEADAPPVREPPSFPPPPLPGPQRAADPRRCRQHSGTGSGRGCCRGARSGDAGARGTRRRPPTSGALGSRRVSSASCLLPWWHLPVRRALLPSQSGFCALRQPQTLLGTLRVYL